MKGSRFAPEIKYAASSDTDDIKMLFISHTSKVQPTWMSCVQDKKLRMPEKRASVIPGGSAGNRSLSLSKGNPFFVLYSDG
ncbi:hypothetical protein QUF72_12855 [Desulfobacterales bacterium HSG2]|nr:hypothetical protein [Desulfobacterales bacterium HSG2]